MDCSRKQSGKGEGWAAKATPVYKAKCPKLIVIYWKVYLKLYIARGRLVEVDSSQIVRSKISIRA